MTLRKWMEANPEATVWEPINLGGIRTCESLLAPSVGTLQCTAR